MPAVHMICGTLGAGKTTLARRLATETKAARFSLDEWIMRLFGTEAPEPMQLEWWVERAQRCSRQIWAVCRQLLACDRDVILDFGFPSRQHRAEYLALARAAGAQVKLYVVSADAQLRRQRVRVRNEQRAETFALTVTDGMFEGSESWWEPPTSDELAQFELVAVQS
jgi:predicted kinase